MGKSMVVKIVAIVLCVATAGAGVGIGVYVANRPTPEKTIERFEDAYNELMIDDMVACFEPRIQRLYSGVSGILGSLIGLNTSDIIDLVCGAMPFLEGYEIDGMTMNMPKIDIEVKDVEIEDDLAEAYVILTFDDGYGNTDTTDGFMTLTYDEDDEMWYLCADNLF